MAKQITTWTPDTCDGLIEVIKIDDEGQPYSVMVPDQCKIDIEGQDWETPISVKSVKKCQFHNKIIDGQPHLIAVWKGENQIKNFVFGIIQEHVPAVVLDNYAWRFDLDRNLEVDFEGILPSQAIKGIIQGQCNGRFGQGKVKIN